MVNLPPSGGPVGRDAEGVYGFSDTHVKFDDLSPPLQRLCRDVYQVLGTETGQELPNIRDVSRVQNLEDLGDQYLAVVGAIQEIFESAYEQDVGETPSSRTNLQLRLGSLAQEWHELVPADGKQKRKVESLHSRVCEALESSFGLWEVQKAIQPYGISIESSAEELIRGSESHVKGLSASQVSVLETALSQLRLLVIHAGKLDASNSFYGPYLSGILLTLRAATWGSRDWVANVSSHYSEQASLLRRSWEEIVNQGSTRERASVGDWLRNALEVKRQLIRISRFSTSLGETLPRIIKELEKCISEIDKLPQQTEAHRLLIRRMKRETQKVLVKVRGLESVKQNLIEMIDAMSSQEERSAFIAELEKQILADDPSGSVTLEKLQQAIRRYARSDEPLTTDLEIARFLAFRRDVAPLLYPFRKHETPEWRSLRENLEALEQQEQARLGLTQAILDMDLDDRVLQDLTPSSDQPTFLSRLWEAVTWPLRPEDWSEKIRRWTYAGLTAMQISANLIKVKSRIERGTSPLALDSYDHLTPEQAKLVDREVGTIRTLLAGSYQTLQDEQALQKLSRRVPAAQQPLQDILEYFGDVAPSPSQIKDIIDFYQYHRSTAIHQDLEMKPASEWIKDVSPIPSSTSRAGPSGQ